MLKQWLWLKSTEKNSLRGCEMATFDTFEFLSIETLHEVLSPDEVPGCPLPLLNKHLRSAARDFCRRSQWLKATLDPITIIAGITTYDLLDVPQSLKVDSVDEIKISGRVLAAAEYDLSDDSTGIELAAEPAAKIRNGMVVRVVLVPTKDCTEFPAHFLDEWSEDIAAGARGSLRRIPGRMWSMPNQSIFDSQQYENGILRAKNKVQRKNKNMSPSFSPRRFAI